MPTVGDFKTVEFLMYMNAVLRSIEIPDSVYTVAIICPASVWKHTSAQAPSACDQLCKDDELNPRLIDKPINSTAHTSAVTTRTTGERSSYNPFCNFFVPYSV